MTHVIRKESAATSPGRDGLASFASEGMRSSNFWYARQLLLLLLVTLFLLGAWKLLNYPLYATYSTEGHTPFWNPLLKRTPSEHDVHAPLS